MAVVTSVVVGIVETVATAAVVACPGLVSIDGRATHDDRGRRELAAAAVVASQPWPVVAGLVQLFVGGVGSVA